MYRLDVPPGKREGGPPETGNPPRCVGRLCAEVVELAVPNATDKRVPLVRRKAENRARSVPAVPDANFAAGQVRYLHTVTICETQRAFHPLGLTSECRHSLATPSLILCVCPAHLATSSVSLTEGSRLVVRLADPTSLMCLFQTK